MLPPASVRRGCCRFYAAPLGLTACVAVLLLSAGCQRAQESGPGRKLEHAASIWALSPSEARRGYPVSLHGQVTYFDLRLGILTLQDSTAGIALETSGISPALSPGQEIDVEGFTSYEANAPIIVKPTIRAGAEMRAASPKRVDAELLWQGKEDYQWVEVTGTLVERLALDSEHARYRVAIGGAYAECTVVTSEGEALTSLVGRDLVIRAVPIAMRNASGSILGLQLYVPSRGNIVAANPRRPAPAPVANEQQQTPAGQGLPLLTSAADVKSLSHEEAARHYPVRIRGVVTFLNPDWSGPIVQDYSAGIYARIDPQDREGWQLGDLVEIEGVSNVGGFSPTIVAHATRRLGPGVLPATRAFHGQSLFGRDENAFVRLFGVVRSVGKWQETGLTLNVASNWGVIPVRIVDPAALPHPEQLVDAEISVDAVGGPLFDQQRHLYAFQLLAQSARQVKVTQTPATALEALPGVSLGSLMLFNAARPLNHRIKVVGTVALRQQNGDVYLASDDGGILVRGGGRSAVRAGDRVEAVGFLPSRVLWLVLEDATFRVTGPGRLPAPKEITVDEAANGSHDARHVRLSAFLVAHHSVRGDHVLTMSAGRRQFTAVLEHPQYVGFLDSLREGSKLQLTGICHVDFDGTLFPPRPKAFDILIPSVDDIELLHKAPWWSPRRALLVSGLMASMVLIVLAWVAVLRRRVAAQAAVLRERMEQQVQLRARLEDAERMESLGRLAGGVAHDFNNLLTVINGYSDLLLNDPHVSEPLKGTINEICNAGSRAAALTRQLLAFSRKQVLQPRVVDLNAVVADTEDLLRRLMGERIQLEVDLKAKTGMVNADPAQITQVLLNLAVNGKDAMPDGGRLLIRTSDDNVDGRPHGEGSWFAIEGERPSSGSYISLSVADEGAGMDEETLSHIFEPFFTTKDVGKGTGLGLSTVFGIVKQSKGYITVQSAPGHGTTFQIFLPRASGTPEPAPNDRPRDLAGKETILVVEDQPEVLALVKTVLMRFGYCVLGSTDPRESLALMRDHRGSIQMVITDMIMPGMSGRQLAEEIERIQPGIRILFMSGYTHSEIDKEDLIKHGLHFIQKPFTPDALAEKVRAVLA